LIIDLGSDLYELKLDLWYIVVVEIRNEPTSKGRRITNLMMLARVKLPHGDVLCLQFKSGVNLFMGSTVHW